MNTASVYRALADETRRKVIKLLLAHNYCVSELARVLGVSESAVSQHLKVLKEAELLTGEKRGYYMHYDINREKLRALAREINELADMERQRCARPQGQKESCGCQESGNACSDEVKLSCHSTSGMKDKAKIPMAGEK